MIAALVLAAGLAAPSIGESPPPEPTPEPGLHRLRVTSPRDCWVWSVPLPDGAFRPVEYEPPTGRPSFETNGVVPSKIEDGPKIRASDPATLARVRAVADGEDPPPDEPDAIRVGAAFAFVAASMFLLAHGAERLTRRALA